MLDTSVQFSDATFPEKTISRLFDDKGQLVCATVISLDQAYQKGPAFKVFVDLIKEEHTKGRIKELKIILTDFLKRHYISIDPTFSRPAEEMQLSSLENPTPEEVEDLARQLGKNWIKENEFYLKESGVPYEIITWESLLTGSYFESNDPANQVQFDLIPCNYPELYKIWGILSFLQQMFQKMFVIFTNKNQRFNKYLGIVNQYYEDSKDKQNGLKDKVKSLTNRFIGGFIERCQEKGLSVDRDICMQNGIQYSLEEAAMTLLIYKELGIDFVTYPGPWGGNDVLKATFELHWNGLFPRNAWIKYGVHKVKPAATFQFFQQTPSLSESTMDKILGSVRSILDKNAPLDSENIAKLVLDLTALLEQRKLQDISATASSGA